MTENNSGKLTQELLRLLSEETLRAISRDLYKELDSAVLGSEECDLILRFTIMLEEELGSIQSQKAAEFIPERRGEAEGAES